MSHFSASPHSAEFYPALAWIIVHAASYIDKNMPLCSNQLFLANPYGVNEQGHR